MGVSPSLNTVGANGSVPSANGSEKHAVRTRADEASNGSQNLFIGSVRRVEAPPRLIVAFGWWRQ